MPGWRYEQLDRRMCVSPAFDGWCDHLIACDSGAIANLVRTCHWLVIFERQRCRNTNCKKETIWVSICKVFLDLARRMTLGRIRTPFKICDCHHDSFGVLLTVKLTMTYKLFCELWCNENVAQCTYICISRFFLLHESYVSEHFHSLLNFTLSLSGSEQCILEGLFRLGFQALIPQSSAKNPGESLSVK